MGTLHVVATPIGNLEDITLRALRVLADADLLFAEDTRRTRILLDHHGIARRTVSLNAHNELARLDQAEACLSGDGHVVLVSDAGTPLVSDPGARLVAAVIEAGHRVEPVPGPSAVLAALCASGLAPQPFLFVGFLPRKGGARRAILEAQQGRAETFVLFESPHRVHATLAELAEILGPERRAAVARELTKIHEEVVRGTLAELAERFAEGARGEVTLVVEGAPEVGSAAAAGQAMLSEADLALEVAARVAAGGRPREVAASLAARSTLPRKALYKLAQAALDADREQAAPPRSGRGSKGLEGTGD